MVPGLPEGVVEHRVHESCGHGKASKAPALSQRTQKGGHPLLCVGKAWASPQQLWFLSVM